MRILILGSGHMAANHVRHFRDIDDVEVVAAVDVAHERVSAFCETHSIGRSFTSLDDALAWGNFDAVANVTPDAVHYPTTMTAIRAGKHVFCEKPLSTDYRSAAEMADAIEAAGLVGMVNLSYRNLPELQQARCLVESGAIGEVRHVHASYLQSWLVTQTWGDWRTTHGLLWKLSRRHGSNGVLGDLGVHLFDFATFGSGQSIAAVTGMAGAFAKGTDGRIGEYELDANDSVALTARFENGALGVLHTTRWATGHINTLDLQVHGDRGALQFRHTMRGTELTMCSGADLENEEWRPVVCSPVPTTYARFVEAVRTGCSQQPDFRRAAVIQFALDAAATAMETGCEAQASPAGSAGVLLRLANV
ncbi:MULTISPECIES: Gfo/Idh/MocA family oxidoreductase [unclassified Devosia]|uniref:Gfo/Idh/MocA family protein n=1 Tax=unclassified Devosia TaxID=196773 RepID=UPI00086BA363|nr:MULTISPECIES: Gfo/Idh/MocA family oxidoreductase [unclassified Devosia]MBN9362781.1 Gfo/Idh/MocA family oxidoreductase [Devosia sp.]ODS88340.1 MAG: oxidoreductase [Devosia sp. SCN 66-27]OJX23957.1 MAG: oxidoreductase [Devosia sp. 66-14]